MSKSHTASLVAVLALVLTAAACGGVEYEDGPEEERPQPQTACEDLTERGCEWRDDCQAVYIEPACADPCGGLDDGEEQLDCFMIECGEPEYAGCEESPEPPGEGCETDSDCGPNQQCLHYFYDEPVCNCAPCADDADCEPCDCGAPEPQVSEGECVDIPQTCDTDSDCGPNEFCSYYEDDGAKPEEDCACPPCADDELCDCDCGGHGAREAFGYCEPLPEPGNQCETDHDCGRGEYCLYADACTCITECPEDAPCDPLPCDCGEEFGTCVID